MELNEDQLKEKALLLLRRERELFDLRMRHEQVTLWLQLTRELPRFFEDPRTPVSEAYARCRKALIVALRWQRVVFLELGERTLTPIVPAGPPRSLSSEALVLLRGEPAGFCNDPTDTTGAELAETLGLARFIWSRLDVPGRVPVVLAAGFDRAKAKFQGTFDGADAAHLRNATQHLQGLIGNALLVQELEHERDRLQQTNEVLERRDRELQALTEQLRAANDNLEQRVRDRTDELGRRNRDMRLVLDNVVQGLLTVDAAGRLARERSARVDEWFGSYEGNPPFSEYITRIDPDFAEKFAFAHEALIEGMLPIDICLDQLPRRLHSGARTFRCSYSSLGETASGCGLLIMIDDTTEQVRRLQEEAEQSELLAVFQGLTRDRAGFLAFFGEANLLVEELTGGALDAATLRRYLHTLKGNAAMRGAQVVADLCHRAEEQLASDAPRDFKATLQRLGQRWAVVKQTLEVVVAERGEGVVEIPSRALEQLCDEIERGLPVQRIARQLMFFRFEPVALPLARLAHYATVLAQRMGRAEPRTLVEANDTRVDPRRFAGLWAVLVHAIRNAIDHGIELPVERLTQGKDARGCIWLRASNTASEFTLEIEDDGRGIDWARVRQIAQARNLPHESESDLVFALLSDGFTTKSSVTAISGRGVGMSAVQAEVLELGGRISVRSEAGSGTCWRMVFPLASSDRSVQVIPGHHSGAGEADGPRPALVATATPSS
ncbi:MAG: ATP-binding protein [Deltaproteobacteria bacterium]